MNAMQYVDVIVVDYNQCVLQMANSTSLPAMPDVSNITTE